MRTPFAVVLIGVAALVVAGCGGDGDAAGAGPTPVEAATDVATPASPSDAAAAEPTPGQTAEAPPTATAEPDPTVTLTAGGFPDLGAGATYEAWVVVDDEELSAGTFTSWADPVVLPLPAPDPQLLFVTIETDDDPAPSTTRLLAGEFEDGSTELSVVDPAAIGADFAGASGEYILGTPTDGNGPPENERSGIWWTFVPRAQSLNLPALTEGWIYEGWQIIDGTPVSTGTFVSTFGEADNAAPFSGPEPGPPFPGEDFLVNAPDGLTFPIDLRGTQVVISVEPVPDTGADPFPIVVLRGDVPDDAEDHTSYPVGNVTQQLPTGFAELT